MPNLSSSLISFELDMLSKVSIVLGGAIKAPPDVRVCLQQYWMVKALFFQTRRNKMTEGQQVTYHIAVGSKSLPVV